MKAIDTKKLALSAVGIALAFVVTAFLQIPMFGGGQGFVHLGDTVLFIFSFVGGPFVGAMTGGFGGFFADLYVFPTYAGFTLVIKAVQGGIVGGLARLVVGQKSKIPLHYFFAIMLLAGAWMVVGYFFVDVIVYGLQIAIAGLPGNSLQIIINAIVAIAVYPQISRMHKADLMQKQNQELQEEIDNLGE